MVTDVLVVAPPNATVANDGKLVNETEPIVVIAGNEKLVIELRFYIQSRKYNIIR